MYVFYFFYGLKQAVIFLYVDLDSVMALQTDLTSDEELSTTIDLSDAQVKNILLQAASCTVIRFVWDSAKFGTFTVVSVNGTLVEAKMCTFTIDLHTLSSTSVSFTLTSVQVPNLALTHMKRMSVCLEKEALLTFTVDILYLMQYLPLVTNEKFGGSRCWQLLGISLHGAVAIEGYFHFEHAICH